MTSFPTRIGGNLTHPPLPSFDHEVRPSLAWITPSVIANAVLNTELHVLAIANTPEDAVKLQDSHILVTVQRVDVDNARVPFGLFRPEHMTRTDLTPGHNAIKFAFNDDASEPKIRIEVLGSYRLLLQFGNCVAEDDVITLFVTHGIWTNEFSVGAAAAPAAPGSTAL
ncbi:hypothetical protein CONLIGDRAFT_637763 [Coniochaeta ligniaria NRRL 30616]|uniref:Uncharacterized protein n=1 Tax=Coniochaeta ligniaria NRRL 30616 TaxID=1408157 RepID=A0A1J7J7A1_9PEZI|nr:hypothetical protein CONLIGDRAFT_637763 [Coniochaeta ligniaria NRRL 30616]